ncbi:DUF4012 domain-containing protein [Microbacterium sp. SSM24]|uniref:DUF4012 domain-containing protein n=1 Tax=Microbacterium sp. SSM24 TaxID=2991714 RepID=UPI00222691F9|nr:DUF4012 domain-containing protein [Microbacterium sp. SSM24]MCW3494598.1 DUF4012 domain-containing protein [Microbacterium sp. SSM24]
MLIVGAAILVAALAWVAWIGVRGWLAKEELDSARALTSDLRDAVESGDLDAASATTERMLAHAEAASGLTSDPLWRGAEVVPVAGANLAAARVISAELTEVLSGAALPMMESARLLVDQLRLPEGGIDTALLASQQPAFDDARATLAASADELGQIDPDTLAPPVGDAVRQLDDAVSDLLPIVGALDDTAAVLPTSLGSAGPRTILVMLQNNAELRTAGGITGSFVELRADAGKLTLVSQADSSEFERTASPIIPIPAATLALYGDQVGRFVQNATMPADFDLSSRLVSQWWQARTGSAPDTVLSVDPLVLRSLLSVTGPIATEQGTITADDLVDQLLVEPYMSLDAAAQTAKFRTTAAAVFTQVADFDIDPVAFATALAAPIAEGRISVWSVHPDEQEILAQTSLAGPAARQRAAGPDAFAVYFNDATGGKMDSLLDVAIAAGSASCRADDRQDVVVSVTLTNTVEPNAVATLPTAMTGGGHFGARVGNIATNVSVSAPEGSFFGGVSVAGEPLLSVDVEEEGLSVSSARVELAPGETRTVEFRFIAARTEPVEPTLLHTPLIGDVAVSVGKVECG